MKNILEKRKVPLKYCSRGKVKNLVFSNFLLVLIVFSFWEEDWTLDYNFIL